MCTMQSGGHAHTRPYEVLRDTEREQEDYSCHTSMLVLYKSTILVGVERGPYPFRHPFSPKKRK